MYPTLKLRESRSSRPAIRLDPPFGGWPRMAPQKAEPGHGAFKRYLEAAIIASLVAGILFTGFAVTALALAVF
jgi:hypothetical protein